jgi:hypothetical protein
MAQTYGIYTEFFGFKTLQADDVEVTDTFTNIMLRGIRQNKAPKKAPNQARNRK